ncbi:MAG TPA: hypothetical protein VHO06_13870 [Polyangia bacterium]|nr:hypothetical protein [Polyangia bacterium]
MTGVACDVCMLSVDAIDAAVFTEYDANGRCVRMGLAHAHCVGVLRQRLGDGEATVADQPAKAFLETTAVRGPKSHSGRLVLERVEQLWRRNVRRWPTREKSA